MKLNTTQIRLEWEMGKKKCGREGKRKLRRKETKNGEKGKGRKEEKKDRGCGKKIEVKKSKKKGPWEDCLEQTTNQVQLIQSGRPPCVLINRGKTWTTKWIISIRGLVEVPNHQPSPAGPIRADRPLFLILVKPLYFIIFHFFILVVYN